MIREGTEVKWNWGKGSAVGKVKEIYSEKITRTINGAEVTRDGSEDDPACIIEQEDGGKVIKLKSELCRNN